MQTCSVKWNYSNNLAGYSLYKSSLHTKHNEHCIIGFLIDVALLNVYFILQCHLFFPKIIFLNVYTSVNTVFECLYMIFGWERGHQLSTYATDGGIEESSKNGYSCVQGEELLRLMCTYALALSLFMFLAAFSCLILYCFICRNLTSPLFKKCVREKQLFSSNKINFCRHEISFFYFKLFLQTKVSQNAFNFNQRDF